MTLDETYGHVAHWQGETFPDATLDGAVAHLKKEALEVVNAHALRHHCPEQDFSEEVADVFFMLVQICELRGTNLADEVMRKLAINKARHWPSKPDPDGCYHHEKGQP